MQKVRNRLMMGTEKTSSQNREIRQKSKIWLFYTISLILHNHAIYTGNQWCVLNHSYNQNLRYQADSSTQTQKIVLNQDSDLFSAKLTSFCFILPSGQVITGCQVV